VEELEEEPAPNYWPGRTTRLGMVVVCSEGQVWPHWAATTKQVRTKRREARRPPLSHLCRGRGPVRADPTLIAGRQQAKPPRDTSHTETIPPNMLPDRMHGLQKEIQTCAQISSTLILFGVSSQPSRQPQTHALNLIHHPTDADSLVVVVLLCVETALVC
jgi:hypothetical protein